MFQLIAVVGVTFVIATVLTRIVLGRSIGDLLRDGLRGEVEPETPTEQLTRRRREAAARFAAVAGQVRDATAAVEELTRREADLEAARARLRAAETARVERTLDSGSAV